MAQLAALFDAPVLLDDTLRSHDAALAGAFHEHGAWAGAADVAVDLIEDEERRAR